MNNEYCTVATGDEDDDGGCDLKGLMNTKSYGQIH